jgi:hypothetical protein
MFKHWKASNDPYRELVKYIIDNESYDILIYSSSGDDISDSDLEYIKNDKFVIMEMMSLEQDTSLVSDGDVYVVYMINVNNIFIEIWVDNDRNISINRDLKINSIINE